MSLDASTLTCGRGNRCSNRTHAQQKEILMSIAIETTTTRYNTVRAVNARLRELALPELSTREAVKAFLALAEPDVIRTTLDTADADTRARRFLEWCVTRATAPAEAAKGQGALPQVDAAMAPPDKAPAGAPERARDHGQAQRPAPREDERGARGMSDDDSGRGARNDDRGAHGQHTGARGANNVLPMRSRNSPGAAAASGRTDSASDAAPQWDQHVVYGSKQAAKFECARHSEGNPALTVNLKCAAAKDGRSCKQGVAWDGGVTVRLEPHEIASCIGVLLGHAPNVRFPGHGPKNDKILSITENEGDYAGTLTVHLKQGDLQFRVPISSNDIIQVIGVFERAAVSSLRMEPLLSETKLRRHAAMQQARLAAKGQGQGRAAG
jgi:hypothetical protein